MTRLRHKRTFIWLWYYSHSSQFFPRQVQVHPPNSVHVTLKALRSISQIWTQKTHVHACKPVDRHHSGFHVLSRNYPCTMSMCIIIYTSYANVLRKKWEKKNWCKSINIKPIISHQNFKLASIRCLTNIFGLKQEYHLNLCLHIFNSNSDQKTDLGEGNNMKSTCRVWTMQCERWKKVLLYNIQIFLTPSKFISILERPTPGMHLLENSSKGSR